MNITFLVGNGFDRALGLKTSYSHFYEEYCKFKSGTEIVDKFRKTIDDDIKKEDGQEEKLWSDVELGLAKVTADYSLDDFVACCEDIHNQLVEYLEMQDAKFSTENKQFKDIIQLISSNIVNFYQDLTPTERQLFDRIREDNKLSNTIVNIITLNYTSTCDKIHEALSQNNLTIWNSDRGTRVMKMGRLVHAHGYIDNFPIMGVCNPNLIENKAFLDNPAFRTLMIKKESINAVGETWREDTNSIISNSNIICIFGTSLGKSDSDYWEYIANWLKEADCRQLIIFKFDPKVKRSKVSYYQQYVKQQEVKENFLDFTDYDASTRAKLCERIHVVINAPKTFVIPEKLKVQYPRLVERNTSPITFMDALRKQEQFAETVAASTQMLDKLDPPILKRIEEAEKNFPWDKY